MFPVPSIGVGSGAKASTTVSIKSEGRSCARAGGARRDTLGVRQILNSFGLWTFIRRWISIWLALLPGVSSKTLDRQETWHFRMSVSHINFEPLQTRFDRGVLFERPRTSDLLRMTTPLNMLVSHLAMNCLLQL